MTILGEPDSASADWTRRAATRQDWHFRLLVFATGPLVIAASVGVIAGLLTPLVGGLVAVGGVFGLGISAHVALNRGGDDQDTRGAAITIGATAADLRSTIEPARGETPRADAAMPAN
jgi:hypothetical protein